MKKLFRAIAIFGIIETSLSYTMENHDCSISGNNLTLDEQINKVLAFDCNALTYIYNANIKK